MDYSSHGLLALSCGASSGCLGLSVPSKDLSAEDLCAELLDGRHHPTLNDAHLGLRRRLRAPEAVCLSLLCNLLLIEPERLFHSAI